MSHKQSDRESREARRARYAAKDVADKLGLKPGHLVRFVGTGDPELIQKVRTQVGPSVKDERQKADVILYWPQSPEEVTPTLKRLKTAIVPDGSIWVISSKKGKVGPGGAPYLPDQMLIPFGLAAGLVDNKICSLSESETAMRFVIRRRDR